MKNKRAVDIGIIVVQWITALVFLSFFAYSICYIAFRKAPFFETEDVIKLSDWTYYDQIDGPKQITPPVIFDISGRDTYTFETTLPENYSEGSVIAFLNLSDIEVAVDGEVIYSWQRDTVPIKGSIAKNSYFLVDIPTEYSGSTVSITRHGSLMKRFTEVYFGEKDAVIRKLEVKNGLSNFFLSLFLLIFSALAAIASFALRVVYKKHMPLAFVSMGIFVASCWLVYNSFVFQFAFRTKYIDGVMSYICTLNMIFGFIFYLDSLQQKRYSKYYLAIGIVECLNQFVAIGLHFGGILPFSQSLLFIDMVILLGIIATFVITIYDVVKKRAKDYQICSVGFLLFMICCAIEIILINVVMERVEGTFILIGLYLLLGFAIAQQFSDIRKMQQERDLATANANARTQFLANMSHEIRTPINSILGMNEMIKKETLDPKIASYAEIVGNSGQLLLSLINDILDFSKIDSGKHEIVMVPYSPKQVINNIRSIMIERAQSKKLKTIFEISDDIPAVLFGDAKSLSEILMNIMSNAVKYTKEGSISFSAQCEAGQGNYFLRFEISDTGIGIKEEDIDKIFDPFSRTDLKKNQSIQGTGLGLAITKELIVEMGGTISIKSEYGVGSTFMVMIPQREPTPEELKANPVEGDEPEEENLSEKYTAPDAKILVVDDTRANIIVVREFLKSVGIVPDIANGGIKAFELSCANKYDLILMDHMMPECDGIEAMHLIKEKRESMNSDTPIVILTANAIKGSAQQYMAEGFDYYLSKPVDMISLIRLVRKYLPKEKVMEAD